METEKRFILALALTFGFLFVWFKYMAPKPIPPSTVPSANEALSKDALPKTFEKTKPETLSKPSLLVMPKTPAVRSKKETPLALMEWTNQPGSLEKLLLKKYQTRLEENAEQVSVVPLGEPASPPLVWEFEIDGAAYNDMNLSYVKTKDADDEIQFEAQVATDVGVRKTFTWEPNKYEVQQTLELFNQGGEKRKVRAWVQLFAGRDKGPEKKSWSFLKAQATPIRAISYINEKTLHWTREEVSKKKEVPKGDIAWAGFDSQYFLLTARPTQGRWSNMELSEENENEMKVLLQYPSWDIPPQATQTYSLRLFAGPKDIGILRSAGASLDRSIDLGNWLGPIARPMLLFLRWVYSFVFNYGIAIILLTVLVRLLLYPLTQMQAKSMRKMQEHKPELDALKEKYKDNKEVYSREVMNYMRTHRMNPMGGCLMLLPQLPIFFALYRVLFNSIELRHAPFVFWIRDLSQHDPYFVLPLLLGISMYFQQKITPNPTADASQQLIMKIMPVMFTVFMLFLPSGLNLYIFVSTLWGVVQQYWVQQKSSGVVVPNEKQKMIKG